MTEPNDPGQQWPRPQPSTESPPSWTPPAYQPPPSYPYPYQPPASYAAPPTYEPYQPPPAYQPLHEPGPFEPGSYPPGPYAQPGPYGGYQASAPYGFQTSPAPAPTPTRRKRTGLVAALGGLAVLAVVAVVVVVSRPSFLGFKTVLDPTAVAHQIESDSGLSLANVTCPADQQVKKGATFQCTAGDGTKITVTITDTHGARYTYAVS